MKNNLARYIALFDVHCGYEYNEDWEYDKTLTKFVTSHDPKLLGKVQKLAKDWKPDFVVYGGDQINLSCISRWTNGRIKLIEGRTIKEDFELFGELAYPIGNNSYKVWIEGNHEERLRELNNRNPQLDGLADTLSVIKQLGMTFNEMVPAGKLWKPPGAKVSFTHGHVVLGSGGDNQNHGKKLVAAYHRSVRAGHLHTKAEWSERVSVDAEDYHSGLIVPPLCRPNLPYAKNRPSANIQGFLLGEYDTKTGSFWDYVVPVIKGEFIVNGKRY